jgi:hypothetical protein
MRLAKACFRKARCQFLSMHKLILSATLLVFAAPALAGTYPVAGKWGAGATAAKGAIDCAKLRVIAFNGNQRTDSKGGVPAYRNRTVTTLDSAHFRIVDEFTTGQISDAHVNYTLRKVDDDHIELDMQRGGTLKLQRCK